VTTEVFGRGVQDNVGSELKWPLQVWCGEGVVHDQERPARMGVHEFGNRADVRDRQQGIGRRF
jgi:hypothetical protein